MPEVVASHVRERPSHLDMSRNGNHTQGGFVVAPLSLHRSDLLSLSMLYAGAFSALVDLTFGSGWNGSIPSKIIIMSDSAGICVDPG